MIAEKVKETRVTRIKSVEKEKYDEIIDMAFKRADEGQNFLYIGTGFLYESFNLLNWSYCVTMNAWTNIKDIAEKLKKDGFYVTEEGIGTRYKISWLKDEKFKR